MKSNVVWIAGAVALLALVGVMSAWWSWRTGQIAEVIPESMVTTCRDFTEGKLQIDEKEYSVALADTDTEKTQGLIGCDSVPHNSGMYFVYDQPREVQYWMRGMTIPIDIVWVAQGKVVGIEENVPPQPADGTDIPRYQAVVPVDAVLEVGAGKAREYGIAEGTTVTLTP
jgi:uncharacterized membrane protein (UPF0127 family)